MFVCIFTSFHACLAKRVSTPGLLSKKILAGLKWIQFGQKRQVKNANIGCINTKLTCQGHNNIQTYAANMVKNTED